MLTRRLMDRLLLIICAISLLWWLELALEWALANARGQDLALAGEPSGPLPPLSVIVPARNEEDSLREALESLMRALPAGGEVLLVNDRSSDRTGEIAREVALSDPRLRVLDIAEVPEGWLGKNHAMQAGYEASRGQYLLFTDADVLYSEGCLARAVALCEGEGVDHLVATPLLITRGFWERLFVPFFSIALVSRFRIWRASRPRSRFYAGIGAFNLVRRSLYETAGTHGAIRGEAVDDLLLGRLVKRAGGRQKLVAGEGCLRVRWNVGLSGLLGGLEKNAYAGFGFNPYLTVAGCLGLLCLTLLPAAAPLRLLWAPGGPAWWAGMAGACVWGSFALLYRLAARGTQTRTIYFLTFPLGALLLCWAIARSALMYHLRGGIRWRGTVYRKGGI